MGGESRTDKRGTGDRWIVAALAAAFALGGPLAAQRTAIEMTLERMVELSLSNSDRMQNLNLSIERTRYNLAASQARLRSDVSLQVSAPEFESSAEPKWNSQLGLNEIVHETTRRWESTLSISQPVIIFGYPTNGRLSLNNRVYRYNQIDDEGGSRLRYYNRYFVRYTQPLFQPNTLKNDLEQAQLSLEGSELSFFGDVVEIVDDLSDDYFDLFEDAYDRVVNETFVANLQLAVAAADAVAQADPDRAIDLDQARVALANAEQQLEQSLSQFRIQAASLKRRLNLTESDSITLTPVIAVNPVPIGIQEATRYALESTPRMRQLDMQYRRNEINLEQTSGRNAFRVDLQFSYGRENQDPVFRNVFGSPTNTYSVDVNARIPIWDGGERKARIASSRISLRQTQLRIEQAERQIVSNVENEVRNIAEYQTRALNMQQNLELAGDVSASSLELYIQGLASMFDVLQSFQTEAQTASNLLDAYLGWRSSLQRIQRLTYFDFELGMPVLERYRVRLPGEDT